MSTLSLIYGTRVRRSDFFVKTGTQSVCANGHIQTSLEFLFCPSCGKRYCVRDVILPTSHVERLMHAAFVSQFDDWWDLARGDYLDGDPGVCLWRVDPVQREDDYLHFEKDWDSATFALGVRIVEYGSRKEAPAIRLPTIANLSAADARIRETFPLWGVPADAECHLYPVLMA
jgi:hypothetical protein